MISNSKSHILLVEDDPSFGYVLRDYLMLNDFNVTHAIDGDQGLKFFQQNRYDVCLLDVMMPHKDGFTLAQEIKEINPKMPIIFLTAKNMKEDVIRGYNLGADDYIIKPFDTEVLLHKIRVVLQRGNLKDDMFSQYEFEFTGFKFNAKQRKLIVGNNEYKLSPKENDLLHVLCCYKNDLMPRHVALMRIWKDDNYFISRSMDVYIAKLRKYLKDAPSLELSNIHGEGFRLNVNE